MIDNDSKTPDLDPSLNPLLRITGLPDEVARAREAQAARNDLDRARYEPMIDAHIKCHRLALDHLAETQQWIADMYDFDVVGDTRPAAMWQMAGRCIGIARLILDSLQLGYTAEVLHLGRALHEADRLLATFHMEGEDALLRKWLDGEYVSPADARKAEERFAARLADAMRTAGIEGDPTDSRGLSREMFGHLSEAAHHRRRWTQDAVSLHGRTMFMGSSDVWIRRAATVGTLVAVVEEGVISVGGALSQFMPEGWYDTHVKPFIETFEALRCTQRLL